MQNDYWLKKGFPEHQISWCRKFENDILSKKLNLRHLCLRKTYVLICCKEKLSCRIQQWKIYPPSSSYWKDRARWKQVIFGNFLIDVKVFAVPWIKSIFLFQQWKKIWVPTFQLRKPLIRSFINRKALLKSIDIWRVMIECVKVN